MNLYERNDGRFPDESDVEVRFPMTDEQGCGGRATWAWVSGTVAGQCGPNEWDVVVEGAGPVEYAEDGEPLYPMVYRDTSEIRPAAEPRDEFEDGV